MNIEDVYEEFMRLMHGKTITESLKLELTYKEILKKVLCLSVNIHQMKRILKKIT